MFELFKPLLESGVINEETRAAITEAWEQKLTEAREEIKAELREEFAQKYQHDKQTMVEAIDKMLNDNLQQELKEFAEEKKQFSNDRVKFKKHVVESAKKFEAFLAKKLAEEIQELRADRKLYEASLSKLDKFVKSALTEEIREFSSDKQKLVEARVKVISEAKKTLKKTQDKFIKESSRLVQKTVEGGLRSEITQLKEDIQNARENMFGRKLFEAFASEFAVTHLNENREIKKLRQVIDAKERQLTESKQEIAKKNMLIESTQKQARIIQESAKRKEIMHDLLKPLNKEKAQVMGQLLESVQTEKLKSAYEKYLPAVLNNSGQKTTQRVLTESRTEATGDKNTVSNVSDDADNVIALKRLAGLK